MIEKFEYTVRVYDDSEPGGYVEIKKYWHDIEEVTEEEYFGE